MPYLLYEIIGTQRYFKLYSVFYVLISKNSSFSYSGSFPYEGCQEHPCLFQNVYGIVGFVYICSRDIEIRSTKIKHWARTPNGKNSQQI